MAGAIIDTDLALGPGKHRRNWPSLPQPRTSGCPWWHRTALWASWTGNLLLGVAVVAVGCSVLHQRLEYPGSCGNVTPHIGDVDITPKNICSELRKALCWSQLQEDKGCTHCPMNWTLRGTKCYWVSYGINSWNSSQEDCGKQEAELLVLDDQEELDFINKNLPKSHFWIGLLAGKDWTWINGSHLDPSRFQLTPSAEGRGCGAIKEGRISSNACGSVLRWICQKKATQL